MPRHNPKGNNQHGDKNYPADDVLHAALVQYAKERLTVQMKLDRLREEYGCEIKPATLHNLQVKFDIKTVRRGQPPREEQAAAILEVVELDHAGFRGVKTTMATLALQGSLLPRDTVREVLRLYAPDKSLGRFPGAKNRRRDRTTLISVGPDEMHHADGWEKLGAQALMMGGVGIPAYGYTDQCSSKRLFIVVVPNDRLQDVIVHVHLDFIQYIGGISITHVVDKGTELGKALAVHGAIRALAAPNLDAERFPPFVQISSFKNTPAEGGWHWLRNFEGYNLHDAITAGRDRFNALDDIQFCLFYWIWPPIVQKALNEFSETWNIHAIRRQHLKANPSGYTPNHVYAAPRSLGLQHCKIPVSSEIVAALREEQELTREQALGFCSASFDEAARGAYEQIGSPETTRDNAWETFFTMLPVLRAFYNGRVPEKAYVFTI
ncbi:hypothetical protein EXIGLDRAFT_729008 [Exidia glandulosa HHB12029]|uniref:Integrase catalytic domain-containing protein n=1 Tax=Exidia glandulosa HHB12029 TaxID=1314781 RepID=A0A165CT65_EXIGL|nr:hypothetical protein EXIGLDRAFT_729008 [Exidia glandulosa HHB12029]